VFKGTKLDFYSVASPSPFAHRQITWLYYIVYPLILHLKVNCGTLFLGIHLYLDGSAVRPKDRFPRKEVTFARPEYGRGWSLGRPNSILKLTKYGNFGIAHLAQWQRELTAVEIKTAFYETILSDRKKLIELLTTRKLKFFSLTESDETFTGTKQTMRLVAKLLDSSPNAIFCFI
jgi:hypothetical protein